jgi:8-oxo-dGTP diphosphatase
MSKKFDIDSYIANLSIDCVIFGYQDKELKVLVSKPKYNKGVWALPGGYILKTEAIDTAANRILKERTCLENIYLEQFRVFGDENRVLGSKNNSSLREGLSLLDQRRFNKAVIDWLTSRFVCIGYYALVDINQVEPQVGEFDECLEWRGMNEIKKMMHDHKQILSTAIEALRLNLDSKLIGFNLLPETFTMKDLQELYEAVYSKPFASNNFQKKILDLNVLERMEKKFTGAQNKAPYLYRFKNK